MGVGEGCRCQPLRKSPGPSLSKQAILRLIARRSRRCNGTVLLLASLRVLSDKTLKLRYMSIVI